MTEATGDVAVVHNPGANHYEIHVGNELAGFTAYRVDGEVWVFVHTEIDDRFEGQGLGSKLIAGALDDARSRRIRIKAECPFVASFLERHPEYADLVAAT
jgi:predicted GNAT family acetyltransferase